MKKKSLKFILVSFTTWRVLLFFALFLALANLSLQKDFLGGGLSNYLKAPYLWSWVNFDGEHYLSIVRRGYQPLTYFYFPVYPLVVRYLSRLIADNYNLLALTGLLVSHTSFFIALSGFWKLIRLDYKKKTAKLSLILLIIFPTSFYFAGFYTESFFLAIIIWSFYFARKKRWLLASILAAIASATRVVGIIMLPVLLAEYLWGSRKIKSIIKEPLKVEPLKIAMISILIVPVGMLAYMFYLNKTTGDPLEFFHSVSIFGQQRSTSIILLPQVFYRYIFKVLPAIHYNYFPVVFTSWLEFFVALIFGVLAVIGFCKLRLSYALYLLLGYLIPTFSGSFSSLPRYVLVLFPAFLLYATYLDNKSKLVKILTFGILFIGLVIATALFTRGYWVS